MDRIKKYKNLETNSLFYIKKHGDKYIAGIDSTLFIFGLVSPSLMAHYTQKELKDIYDNKAI